MKPCPDHWKAIVKAAELGKNAITAAATSSTSYTPLMLASAQSSKEENHLKGYNRSVEPPKFFSATHTPGC